jgi:hypothetical protein
VIEAQCASILVPHDHLHINQIRASVTGGRVGNGIQIIWFGAESGAALAKAAVAVTAQR